MNIQSSFGPDKLRGILEKLKELQKRIKRKMQGWLDHILQVCTGDRNLIKGIPGPSIYSYIGIQQLKVKARQIQFQLKVNNFNSVGNYMLKVVVCSH